MDLPRPDEKYDTHDEKDEALRGKDGVDDHELGASAGNQGARAAKAKQSNELVKRMNFGGKHYFRHII